MLPRQVWRSASAERAIAGNNSIWWKVDAVRELIRSNDMVLMSAVGALLDGAGIEHMVLDQNMSVLDGSLGILPRRLVVGLDDLPRARDLLRQAGLGHELRPDVT